MEEMKKSQNYDGLLKNSFYSPLRTENLLRVLCKQSFNNSNFYFTSDVVEALNKSLQLDLDYNGSNSIAVIRFKNMPLKLDSCFFANEPPFRDTYADDGNKVSFELSNNFFCYELPRLQRATEVDFFVDKINLENLLNANFIPTKNQESIITTFEILLNLRKKIKAQD